MKAVRGVKPRWPLTLAVLLANGLTMLHAATAADRARCPIAEPPLMLSSGADIERGQRELVVYARVALVAPHDRLEGIEASKPYWVKPHCWLRSEITHV